MANWLDAREDPAPGRMDVFIWPDSGDVGIGYFNEAEKKFYHANDVDSIFPIRDITHWMMIEYPEPPKAFWE